MTTPEQPDASRQLLRQQTPHTEIKSITNAQNIVSGYLMLDHKKNTTVVYTVLYKTSKKCLASELKERITTVLN